MAFTFLPLGANIQTFKINNTNIVQGFDTAEQYKSHNKPFFGETIGRVANRVSGAKLLSVSGKDWPLTANDRGQTCHSGFNGWGKREWNGPKPVGLREIPGVQGLQGGESVEFTLTDKGEEGFPGTVEVRVVYTTGTVTEGGKEVVVLGIDYEAKLVDGAEETPINITNHSYFNLAGAPHAKTFAGTQVTLATNQHLPVDDNAIPTGGPTPYPGLDTTKPFVLSGTEDGPDVDHCFTVLTDPKAVPLDTRGEPLRMNLTAYHPDTKLHLEVLSTEPSFQFYTGQGIDVDAVGDVPARGKRSGFCCEPGRFVNAVNVPEWRATSVAKKGEVYGSRVVYKGWSD